LCQLKVATRTTATTTNYSDPLLYPPMQTKGVLAFYKAFGVKPEKIHDDKPCHWDDSDDNKLQRSQTKDRFL